MDPTKAIPVGLIFLTLCTSSHSSITTWNGRGEPDWNIAKADLVQEFYSYENLQNPPSNTNTNTNTNLRFPVYQPPLPPPQQQQQQQQQRSPSPPPPPKVTKFSILDKKEPPPLFHPATTPATTTSTTPSTSASTSLSPVGGTYRSYGEPSAVASDSQTIVWPQNMEQKLSSSGDETALRFLVHKDGDEGEIKKALLQDGKERGQEVKFIEGPTLRIQRHQKVYLPPKKKTVVYILLKEPQIMTDVEVVGPTEEPVPEVFITYQKSDGGVKTKHYSPEVVKSDKYLSQLRSSLGSSSSSSSPAVVYGGDVNLSNAPPQKFTRSAPPHPQEVDQPHSNTVNSNNNSNPAPCLLSHTSTNMRDSPTSSTTPSGGSGGNIKHDYHIVGKVIPNQKELH
jgi:hypothetical protein